MNASIVSSHCYVMFSLATLKSGLQFGSCYNNDNYSPHSEQAKSLDNFILHTIENLSLALNDTDMVQVVSRVASHRWNF